MIVSATFLNKTIRVGCEENVIKKRPRLREPFVAVWPPVIEHSDIGWEVAIVLVAFVTAVSGAAGFLQGFAVGLLVLITMMLLYVWMHCRKRLGTTSPMSTVKTR